MQELELAPPEAAIERKGAQAEPSRAPLTAPSKHARSLVLIFAVSVVVILLAAAIRWALDHPYGVHWDEAEYFNNVQVDVHRLQSGMLVKLAGRWLVKTWGRPPAYRILATPPLALFGFHTFTARLISLACFALSCWFIYLTVRCVASQAAAALATLVFALSPEVVSASLFFGTDTSLYLATSATMYFLFAAWSGKKQTRQWIGLGAALGLGFLAKTSFLAIAIPLLAFWFAGAWWGKLRLPNPLLQWKAAILVALIAGPWWAVNLKAAIAYGHYARAFVRNSLGAPSLGTTFRWLNTVVQCLLGHGVAVLLGLLLIAVLVSVARKRSQFDSLDKATLLACACAGLPIMLAQLSGANHLLRHISPAMIPLAIAAGILFEKTQWTQSRALVAIACLLFCVQLEMLIEPVIAPNDQPLDLGFINGALPWRTMVRFDQWDWKPVRDLAADCGAKSPTIAYLGNGRAFNKPQIEFPFVERASSMRGTVADIPDAAWLWRYENGPIDWQAVMSATDKTDVILTAPRFAGEAKYGEDRDNQYNAEYADRLARDPQFQPAVVMEMGRFAPVEVLVYLNKNLACPVGQGTSVAK